MQLGYAKGPFILNSSESSTESKNGSSQATQTLILLLQYLQRGIEKKSITAPIAISFSRAVMYCDPVDNNRQIEAERSLLLSLTRQWNFLNAQRPAAVQEH